MYRHIPIKRITMSSNKNPNNEFFFNNFLLLTKNLCTTNKIISDELIINKTSLYIFFKNTSKIINTYLKEKENANDKKKIFTSKNLRNIQYLAKKMKIMKKNSKCKANKSVKKKISHFFTIFLFNILKENNIIKNKESNKRYILNDLLNNMLYIFVLFYLNDFINDDYFELILKYLLIFTMEIPINSTIKQLNEKYEIINIIYFKSCINLIKISFNKIFFLQKQFSQRQEEIINNIILFIKEKMLDSLDKTNKISYINKVFLSKNDCNNLLLIDLIFIISKIKSKKIIPIFIELLTNIYYFSFNYENIMRPMLIQLEPLIVNIQSKSIKKLNEEINISDFPLSLLDALNNKENQILMNNSCFLKQGFYLGNQESGIVCDFNSLNNEFVIFFGFRLQNSDIKEITLFEIKYNKDNSRQIKIFLKSNDSNNNYEMFAEDKNDQVQSFQININVDINYIFSIHFKIGGLMHHTSIKVNYIRDNIYTNNKEDVKKELKEDIKEIKIKNFRTEDFSLYFGCDINNNGQDIINKFRGYIGDIIILNGANFKNLYDNTEIDKLLFNLKGKYPDIFSLSAEIQESNIFIKNENNGPNFIELKEKIKTFRDNENTLFDAIKIISSNYFKLVNYEDNVDYLDSKKKLLTEKNKTIIKKKYFDCKIKSDSSEDIRAIKIYTSIFDKKFHVFHNKLTISEFIKYDGIDYLSLLIEYYFQILSHISINRNNYKKRNIEDTLKLINMKISINLEFFYNNIIQNKSFIDFDLDKISKYFYQVAITLIKFIELYLLNIETIKCLMNILNSLDSFYAFNDKVDTIRFNLFDFFLNPNIYQNTDENILEKVNYVIKNLYQIIKNNSVKQTNLMKQLHNIEILNKILAFSWLIDDYSDNEKLKNSKLLETAKNYYSSLLLEFLKSFTPSNLIIDINNTKFTQKNLVQLNIENNSLFKSTKNLIKENNDDEMKLIYYYFEKALEKKKKHIYIFSNMISILLKTNFIAIFDELKIKTIQTIISKQLKKKDSIKNQQVFISCLKLLIAYYFADYHKKRYKDNKLKSKERNFHLFLRSININLDFFYSLILILKQIHLLFKEDHKDEKNCEKNNENNNCKNKEEENNNSNLEKEEEKNITPIKPLLLFEIDLKNLNDIQINIIKSIFEDIVFLLYKFELRKIDRKNKKADININESSDHNTAKEIYITLKQYIDYIHTYKETTIYQKIFSSDAQICAELFFLNWKFHFNNFEENYVEKVITDYHNSLLKNHSNPFIFKFYLFISNKNYFSLINNIDNKDNEQGQKDIKIKLKLLKFIVNYLTNFQKEIQLQDESIIFLISNILNLLIILNEELSISSSIFQNNLFYDIFYKFCSLLDKSYLLYSNFYIEFDDNYGKIICEIIYDIFFIISEYTFNEKEFVKIFTKDNRKEREIYSIFYLIDIFKEKILDKEKNVNEALKKFLPNIDNLRYIHKNFFNKNNNKLRIFLDKKLYQINDINFSIYFLAKSFIYLNKKLVINDIFKEFLSSKYLPLLSKNIYRLYTKRSSFYGNKICIKFLLYALTKKFIETYIIPNPNKFNTYDEFFASDLTVELKEEYNISYCFTSRLLHDFKRRVVFRNEINQKEKEKLNKTEDVVNRNLNNDFESYSSLSTRTNTLRSISFLENTDFEKINNLSYFTSNIDDIESSKSLDNNSISEIEENEYFSKFQLIKKSSNIYRPRNYFFKIVFSEIYKNLIFNDNIFKLIKLQYLSTYRTNNINISTKQIAFPVKQKNFSNSVEPKIFLRKNFNFYDEKFLKISHNYINFEVLQKYKQNLALYPHYYKIKEQKEDIKNLFCELVTSQYIYFGKMYFINNYIFFESEKEDLRDSNHIEIFMKYSISNMSKYNKTLKKKSILIYNDDIYEIIQKRTLFLDRALEIFHKNGKSFLFNYFREDNIQKAYEYFNEINNNLLNNSLPQFIFKTNNNEDDIKRLVHLFHKGKITNYEYILYLNKYSTRTYNDSNQYPVFPWILKDYDNITEIFKLLSNRESSEDISSYFRDMNYPISMQTEEARNLAKNYFTTSDMSEYNFNFHLNTHYSTSAYIYYYLMRINPYEQNMILLQENHFDSPARLFNCFVEAKSILLRENNNDNREIIPEIFTTLDYFCNLNCCFFGKKNNGDIVDDLIISYKESPTISSYVNFIFNNKKLLNNNYVSKILSHWVDIIFGRKQLPEKKEELYESCNIYNVYCYGQIMNVEKKNKKYI